MPCIKITDEATRMNHLLCAGMIPAQKTTYFPPMSPDHNCTFEDLTIKANSEPVDFTYHGNMTLCKMECLANENCYFWSLKGGKNPSCSQFGIDYTFRVDLMFSKDTYTGTVAALKLRASIKQFSK